MSRDEYRSDYRVVIVRDLALTTSFEISETSLEGVRLAVQERAAERSWSDGGRIWAVVVADLRRGETWNMEGSFNAHLAPERQEG